MNFLRRIKSLNGPCVNFLRHGARLYSTEDSGPVKYSSSKASRWKAEYSRSGAPADDSPWFETYAVTFSVAVFLIYFCYLREENDLDEMLSVQLYDRIDGLEESQLRAVLNYNIKNGLSTEDIEKRLKELEKERMALSN